MLTHRDKTVLISFTAMACNWAFAVMNAWRGGAFLVFAVAHGVCALACAVTFIRAVRDQ